MTQLKCSGQSANTGGAVLTIEMADRIFPTVAREEMALHAARLKPHATPTDRYRL